VEIFRAAEITLASLDTPINLYFFGDVHLGARGCDEERFLATINRIDKDPCSLAFDVGDSCDFIDEKDPRWDPMQAASWLRICDLDDFGAVMADRYSEMVYPIRERLIGRACGNHEEKYRKRKGHNVHGMIAGNLGIRELSYLNDFDILFRTPGNETSRLFVEATHGKSGATTRSGKLNALRKVMQDTVADLVVMGHVHAKDHELILRRDICPTTSQPRIQKQLGLISGTYLQTYIQGKGGYGEQALYSPSELGSVCVTVVPRTLELSYRWV
jgi:UDP-2,3-diacylglucosamine pyrophosphatase LpxH